MIKIYYESEQKKNNSNITIQVGLQGYVDGEEIDDLQENDTATKLVEDMITDIPEALNDIIIKELKEELEANGNEDTAELIQSIEFDDNCAELLPENILEINGTFLCEDEISDFELKKIEKYLGGSEGIVIYELPGDAYQTSDESGLVEICIDPGYDVKVTVDK